MRDAWKVFLGFGIFGAVVAVLVVSRHMASRTIFNTSDVNGNTGSNLYNNGLFCESDGQLYFANPDDDFKLYVSDKNGGNLKKLSDDTVSFLNADENYVYYCRNNTSSTSQFSFLHVETNSLCRVNKDGSGKPFILDHDPDLYACLVENEIYYLHYNTTEATTLYRTGIDGKGTEQVDPSPIYACAPKGGYIYYSGVDGDFGIHRIKADTGEKRMVFDCMSYHAVPEGDYIYYMDAARNYGLSRVNLTTNETESLTTDRADCFLVDEGVLIYQKNSSSSPALMRLIPGNPPEKIADGNFHSLNSAYGQLYFLAYDDDTQIFRTPLLGGPVDTFHPGKAE